MIERLQRALADDSRIAYALVFGSTARAASHAQSDLDIAIGLSGTDRLSALDVGGLAAKLEEAVGRTVDLVLLDEAPPGLAYRVFRDGRPIVIRDEQALKDRFARAVLEYLDFRPIETIFTEAVMRSRHGR